jgi:hypothetical protein
MPINGAKQHCYVAVSPHRQDETQERRLHSSDGEERLAFSLLPSHCIGSANR